MRSDLIKNQIAPSLGVALPLISQQKLLSVKTEFMYTHPRQIACFKLTCFGSVRNSLNFVSNNKLKRPGRFLDVLHEGGNGPVNTVSS